MQKPRIILDVLFLSLLTFDLSSRPVNFIFMYLSNLAILLHHCFLYPREYYFHLEYLDDPLRGAVSIFTSFPLQSPPHTVNRIIFLKI